MTSNPDRFRPPWLFFSVFLAVFLGHAFYLRHLSALPATGWADLGVGTPRWWGFEFYLAGQDYFVGFSYALGTAFAAWALAQYLWTRRKALAAGAAGSVTFVGVLMAGGCFLIGCCGSPMLGVYLGLFGAKALGVGKPLMALVTVLSVIWGYWYLSRKLHQGECEGAGCACKGMGRPEGEK
jgi:hypothetical protein